MQPTSVVAAHIGADGDDVLGPLHDESLRDSRLRKFAKAPDRVGPQFRALGEDAVDRHDGRDAASDGQIPGCVGPLRVNYIGTMSRYQRIEFTLLTLEERTHTESPQVDSFDRPAQILRRLFRLQPTRQHHADQVDYGVPRQGLGQVHRGRRHAAVDARRRYRVGTYHHDAHRFRLALNCLGARECRGSCTFACIARPIPDAHQQTHERKYELRIVHRRRAVVFQRDLRDQEGAGQDNPDFYRPCGSIR